MSSEPASHRTRESEPDPREEPGEWIQSNQEWLREQASRDTEFAKYAKRLLHSEGLSL